MFPLAEGRQLFRRREESQKEEGKSKADSVIRQGMEVKWDKSN